MLLIFSVLAVIILMFGMIVIGMHSSVDLEEPAFLPDSSRAEYSDSLRVWKDNYLKINPSGLIEMRISGSAFERGEAIGKLAPDLLKAQEKAFVDKLYEIVPSGFYRRFLMYFIYIFNRDLGRNVPLECRQEIKAMSEYCTHDYDDYGLPYERQMQYHSAHDIGHVMQDYMLVGCTSFAVWGDSSSDGEIIAGRNFDFYMGEEFAGRNIVLVEKPDSGYAYVSVTWPGMTGVVSGMNERGLTVSLNASKLETPKLSATPVSILAKQILQYAADIDEAVRIAGSVKTFVSESFLVCSASDGRAAVIEKTPSEMAVYDPARDNPECNRVVCTNHYQSYVFNDREENVENLLESDSGFRFRRVEELLDSIGKISPETAALILRDRRGVGGVNIGMCNELSINQLLAMHSVIFKPCPGEIWVSAGPWQCGVFQRFSLREILDAGLHGLERDSSEDIDADPFIFSPGFDQLEEFKRMSGKIRKATAAGTKIPIDSLNRYISLNPLYYNAYNIAGDYWQSTGNTETACELWKKSLTFEMKPQERTAIENKIERYNR
ncbi:MAG: C45 family autoproteolytic acyltransferase/hydrolase [Candidatus Cryptobacteroides sp.]